jgi:hypothetical protein
VQRADNTAKDGQCVVRPVRFAFLEIISGLCHCVGDMSEAKHANPCRFGKGVQRGGFHLDSENPSASRIVYGFRRFPKGASVVQLAPTTLCGPRSAKAAAAAVTNSGSASANSEGGA